MFFRDVTREVEAEQMKNAFLATAAVAYFLIVVPMNKIQERRAAKTAKGEPDPTPKSEDIILLEQIRDLLSGSGPGTASAPRPTPHV